MSRRDANVWLQVDFPGVHIIQFGMREDGLAFDQILLALDPDYVPAGAGPDETVAD